MILYLLFVFTLPRDFFSWNESQILAKFYIGGGRGLNLIPCIFYALPISIELSSQKPFNVIEHKLKNIIIRKHNKKKLILR